MRKNSIDILENWLGDELGAKTSDIVSGMPDNQLTDLWTELATGYRDWDDAWAVERSDGEQEYLLFSGRIRPDFSSDAWLNTLKTSALCFDELSFPDPLAEKLYVVTELSELMHHAGTGDEGVVPKEELQQPLHDGIEILAKVRPLVNEGAIRLVPQTFLEMHADVQRAAQVELRGVHRYIEKGDGTIDTARSELALLGGLCARFNFAPIAGTHDAHTIIGQSMTQFRRNLPPEQCRFESVLNSFRLPNVDNVPLTDILNLRRNSEAIQRARRGLDFAMMNAKQSVAQLRYGESEETFDRAFVDELERLIINEFQSSSVLKDRIIPFTVGVGVGLAHIALDTEILENLDELIAHFLGVGGIGMTWLLTSLFERLRRKQGGENHVAQLYGNLISLKTS